jgi:ATP-binding cassette subfamily B protein
MWRVDPELTMVAITPLFVQGLVALVFWRVYLHYRYEAGRLEDANSTLIGTIIGTAQSIRLLALQSVFLGHVDDLGRQRRRNAIRQSAYEQLSTRSLVDVSVAIACAMSLWYAVPDVAALRVGVGDLLLFFSGLSIVAALPQTWATCIGDYAQQRVSIERLTEAMPDAPDALIRPQHWWVTHADTPQHHHASEPLDTLRIEQVTYRYPDGRGITDVSFVLPRGSLTVVTGRVGSGKSTILNLCAGLLDAQSGTFVWNTTVRATMRGCSVASVPQLPFLFSASLHENMCLGYDAPDLPEAIEASMLSTDLSKMPAGLETIVGPRGIRLSGGQRQRVALARALVRRCELLVLDDISSALDSATEAALIKKLRQHHKGSILASSTRPALLDAADTIIVLAEGKIVGVGTLAMLLQTNPTMQALWADFTQPSSSHTEQRIDSTATTE